MSRHLVAASASNSSSGKRRQRISCRFSCAAAAASSAGDVSDARSTDRGPRRPFSLASQPDARTWSRAPSWTWTSIANETGRFGRAKPCSTSSRMQMTVASSRPKRRESKATKLRRGQPANSPPPPSTTPKAAASLQFDSDSASTTKPAGPETIANAGGALVASPKTFTSAAWRPSMPPKAWRPRRFECEAAGFAVRAGNPNQDT
mmetsp:Transcript_5491/g.17367  ORF Transcript_5491/g.17367 Transcript_5491/m.17367 type:complete len:205 (+) Transcript_5491:2081-2695(+)